MHNGNLFTRDDTFFGVCEGLGEDLSIPPNLLRLAFAGMLFWNPMAAIATYFGLGLFIAVLRWTLPTPRAAAPATAAAAEADASVPARTEVEADPVPLAA